MYRVLVDWNDDGYASPWADITRDVEAFRLRHGLIADADPYRLVNASADGSASILNVNRRYSADSRQTPIGTTSLLQEHAARVLNPLDEIEWEGRAGVVVIEPQDRFSRGEIELFGALRSEYAVERSEVRLAPAPLEDVIDDLVRSVTGAAAAGNILNAGQTIQNVTFEGRTVDYIDALAIYAGGVAFEGARGGLFFASLSAARTLPSSMQVLPSRVRVIADRTRSYRRIPLLRNLALLRRLEIYESPVQVLAPTLVVTIPSDGRSYSYVVATTLLGTLSVNWPAEAVLQAQLPAGVAVRIVRATPHGLELSFINSDPMADAGITLPFEGSANLARQEVVEQRVASSVAIFGDRPVAIEPWYTRSDFAWAASYLQFASAPLQYSQIAFSGSVAAARVTTGTILELQIADADDLPLNHRAIVVGVELEGGIDVPTVKIAHCVTVFDALSPTTVSVWDAAVWGTALWGG